MTGFIRGLFGGKAKNPGEADRPVRQQPSIERAKGAYYLEPDDAKSYGDIDYMRTVKTVRRTFAKKRGEAERNERVRQISSTEAIKLSENGLPQQKPAQAESSFQPTVSKDSSFSRSKVDTNLDMFRQMAKDIKR